ncbi:VanZ family protein [Atopobium fossor]|uniref:VanZ family protein n=1 Tax=Atopobium fossor TaxID=39487 RepID=UPI000684101C|nr:VanZ family protein [Atopobium fossor]
MIPNTKQHMLASVPFILLLLWTLFIWGNSLVIGEASTAQSNRVVEYAVPLLNFVGLQWSNATFIVRKFAHFLEYSVLGVLGLVASRHFIFQRYKCHGRLLAVMYLLAVPCIDETIQLFVPGREGSLRDICIDLSGIAFGVFLALVVRFTYLNTCSKQAQLNLKHKTKCSDEVRK